MAQKTLYVGNLPYSTNADDLVAHFLDFGGSNARILDGRGFGFVDIAADQLDAAILAKHNSDLGGRRLTVNEARPKGAGGERKFGGPTREFTARRNDTYASQDFGGSQAGPSDRVRGERSRFDRGRNEHRNPRS